jgi:hypothetical protein
LSTRNVEYGSPLAGRLPGPSSENFDYRNLTPLA